MKTITLSLLAVFCAATVMLLVWGIRVPLWVVVVVIVAYWAMFVKLCFTRP